MSDPIDTAGTSTYGTSDPRTQPTDTAPTPSQGRITDSAAQRYYDEQRARRNRPEGDTMSTTTQATERTADHDSVERDVEAIEQALDHLSRLVADRSMRWNNAAAAGAALAYEVERFLDDPDGVGTGALRAAWSLFMGRHSGNFTDSAMEAG